MSYLNIALIVAAKAADSEDMESKEDEFIDLWCVFSPVSATHFCTAQELLLGIMLPWKISRLSNR